MTTYKAARSIVSIDSFKEAEQVVKQHASKALILMDLDDTVMIAHDKMMRYSQIDLHKYVLQALSKHPQKEQLIAAVFEGVQFRLVEEEIARLIQDLRHSAFAVLGFTARYVGPLTPETSCEDWTFKQLGQLGVAFSARDTLYSRCKNGILFCGSQPKGVVLAEFLPEVDEHINTIIMFDDLFDNVTNVAQAIEHWNAKNVHKIHFRGFHYKAAEYHDQVVDMEIINRQIHYLITDGVYYSEEAIKAQFATTQNRESEMR